MTEKKHRNRPICLPCMLGDDGAIYAPIVESNIVDIIRPGELEKMAERIAALGAPRHPKASGFLAAIRQWVVNRVGIGKW